MNITLTSASPAATQVAGTRLASVLLPGDILLLTGDLGSGKTTFVQGVAAGLGCTDLASSPTFVLIHQYRGGRLGLAHADLYRLSNEHAVHDIGLFDLLDGTDVVMIEWPDRLGAAQPDAALTVRFELTGENERELTFSSLSASWHNRIESSGVR